jgi:D-alanyl-D-alanine dipeptidase
MAHRLAMLVSLVIAAPAFAADGMPGDFVYLRDVDPTIQQDMPYAGANNFTGKKVPGYDAPECVLVRQAAEALKAVQADIRAKGFALRVYDCYRPTKAVAAFVDWAKLPDDPKAKATWYPNLNKSDLFPNYIATRSGHSRGATLDLTLMPIAEPATAPSGEAVKPRACTAPQEEHAPDGSLAMGTTFDCFDGKSTQVASNITAEQNANRIMLANVMRAHGFKDYAMEWWHFTLEAEPFPDTYFDFPIEPRQ